VIEHRKEFITIDDTATYKRCRVQLHAKGIVLRDEIEGARIKTKTQQVCRTNEFLVAEIDAKVGGFGMVPDNLNGAIVSSHYFLFTVDRSKLLPEFLGFYVRTPNFRDQVKAQGSTNYAAIRSAHVLEYLIPLPPVDEQRRIVAKIEGLAAKIDEAHGLRDVATRMAIALPSRAASVIDELDADTVPLGTLLREKSRNGLSARPSDQPIGHPILRISAGTSRSDGVVEESDHKYLDVTDHELQEYRLESGDLLACRFNGNLHYVGRFSLYAGTTGRTHLHPDKLIRFRVDTSRVSPEYIRAVMNSPYGRERIESFCQTTAGNIGISAKNLNTIPVPVPTKQEQHRIVVYLDALQEKVKRLKILQQKTAAELDALLPSILDKAFKGEL
jgi:type I restriction enzyme S subunit